MNPKTAPQIAIVLKGYPRLSESFIAQEIHALEARGLALAIHSLRHPTDTAIHPVHREIRAAVNYLPEYLHDQLLRVLKGWWRARRLPGYVAARRAWRRDLSRDFTRNRIRRFGQACVLASELAPETKHIYAHFLHTPASVARYAAMLRELPWSCSAHAKDIWTTPEWEKREKLADLDWLVTCTQSGREHLAALAPRAEKVRLVYHGLDLKRFPPFAGAHPPRDGKDASDPVRLLSVGRVVEKKGYEDLLQALARLPASLSWRLTHIGGGQRRHLVKKLAAELGLEERIEWLGARPQEDVLQAYRAADLFVLASRIAADGDRDGLPNVLMEAGSQRLACLSTEVSAIPELITSGENGILVTPGDIEALIAAMERLIGDPSLRARLGTALESRVRSGFSHAEGIETIAQGLGAHPPATTQSAAAL